MITNKPIVVYNMTHGNHTICPYGVGISPCLTQRMGIGGNQVPLILETKYKRSDGAMTVDKTHDNSNRHSVLYKRLRRLTPLECERLQGLPDNYTLIDDKSCSDSTRYKAIGNGMAQPCADYVIKMLRRKFS